MEGKVYAYAIIFLVIGIAGGFAIGWFATGGGLGPGVQLGTLKAGFIYVGPIADVGWTKAHDIGREFIDDKYDWLTTMYLESVSEEEAADKIDYLIAQGCRVVFTTSFGFMDATIAAGTRHPEKIFFHCSGYLRSDNVGTYFADFYQLYYLNGLMAGALSTSGKIGYVAAFPIPELVRHINAYALGAREINASAECHVRWLKTDWYDPPAAELAATSLIADGCDVLAFTEDSSKVVETAEANDVYSFSHYSPMRYYGNNTCISGQLVHWEYIYDDIIQKIYLGQFTNENLENVDYMWLLKEGGVELGGLFGEPINPVFVDDLKAVPYGTSTVYDLVFDRLEQMSEENVVFDPFTGPIKAQNGTIMIADGVRATWDYLATIDWFVEGVVGNPAG